MPARSVNDENYIVFLCVFLESVLFLKSFSMCDTFIMETSFHIDGLLTEKCETKNHKCKQNVKFSHRKFRDILIWKDSQPHRRKKCDQQFLLLRKTFLVFLESITKVTSPKK